MDNEKEAGAAPAAPAQQQHYRKLTSELSLKELAAEFFAVSALGGDVTLSAGACQKLFEAMTTPPAVPAVTVSPAPRVEDDELPISRSTYGSLEECEHEHARRAALRQEFEAWFPAVHGTPAEWLFRRLSDDRRYEMLETEYAWLAYRAAHLARQAQPTDLSPRLRSLLALGEFGPDHSGVITQAADEIERYHGAMLAWKQTAEKKDRDWNEARMARENDRVAARAQPTDRDAEWISVEDKFPEVETDVLVRGMRGSSLCHEVAGIFNGEWLGQNSELELRFAVTHWMPLPAIRALKGKSGEGAAS